MKLPYVFIFDIDQCIVGNVKYIVEDQIAYKLLKELYNNSVNYNPDYSNIIRPGFVEFVKYIKNKFKPCELFLYTNSSYNWANTGIIPIIEKSTKIKFNKPYFTRETSILFNKSLDEAYEKIFPILQKKYKISLKHKDYIINNNLVFIDNIKQNTTTHSNRQITCPDYDLMPYICPYENMLEIFGKEILWKKEVEKNIFTGSKEYYNPNSDDVYTKDILIYNLYKAIRIRNCEINNEKYKNDDFYINLCNKLPDLTDKTIAKLQ